VQHFIALIQLLWPPDGAATMHARASWPIAAEMAAYDMIF